MNSAEAEDARMLTGKLEREAREYCAMFLMREERRQGGLSLRFRRQKLTQQRNRLSIQWLLQLAPRAHRE